jgi:IS5 family transposase
MCGKGMKLEVVADRGGVPVGLAAAAANVAETALAGPALGSVPVPVPAGVPVVADKGYDSDKLRDALAAAGFRLLAPHRKSRVAPSRNDGRRMRRQGRRWVVERTNAWVHSFRRVMVRHEWYPHLHLGFAHLACAFIALGRL